MLRNVHQVFGDGFGGSEQIGTTRDSLRTAMQHVVGKINGMGELIGHGHVGEGLQEELAQERLFGIPFEHRTVLGENGFLFRSTYPMEHELLHHCFLAVDHGAKNGFHAPDRASRTHRTGVMPSDFMS